MEDYKPHLYKNIKEQFKLYRQPSKKLNELQF